MCAGVIVWILHPNSQHTRARSIVRFEREMPRHSSARRSYRCGGSIWPCCAAGEAAALCQVGQWCCKTHISPFIHWWRRKQATANLQFLYSSMKNIKMLIVNWPYALLTPVCISLTETQTNLARLCAKCSVRLWGPLHTRLCKYGAGILLEAM